MMISILVATMLSMAAKDPLDAPRKAYSNCLIELHNEAVKNKQGADEFKTAAEAACEKEKTGFSDAVYKEERRSLKEADAKERAAEEVLWTIEWIVDSFNGNRDEGGQLSKQ